MVDIGTPSLGAKNQLWIVTDAKPVYAMDLVMVVTENHNMTAEITEHNVEQGGDITDNVRMKPARVSFEVFISNQPLFDPRLSLKNHTLELPKIPGPAFPTPGAVFGAVGGAVNGLLSAIFGGPPPIVAVAYAADTEFDNVEDALDTLQGIQEEGKILKLFTTKKTYNSMLLESVGMTRGQAEGDGATLHLTFKEVRIVETKKTKAPKMPRAKAPVNKGTQPTAEAPEQAGQWSVAKGLKAFFAGGGA